MKPEILNKWVKALRSGKYEQGQNRLKTLNGQPKYCCLAVLCDLHAQENGTGWVDYKASKAGHYLGERHFLPEPVKEWAGLKDRDPQLGKNTASEENDAGKEFKTIANLIVQAQKKKLI